MERPEMISIEFTENSYLIQLEEYGLCALENELDCEVRSVGSKDNTNLLHFFGSVSVTTGFISMVDN